MTTSTDVLNQALQIMGGNQPPVTGSYPNFVGPSGVPGTAIATAANALYGPAVAAVQRQHAWDASRKVVALELSGNAAPRLFAFEYKYPANGIQVWELVPAVDADPNDPLPVNYVIGNNVVGAAQVRVIHTDLPNAFAVYNNNPNENTWDALFREAVARLLASELTMALAGKPDLSESLLQSGSAFESLGEARPD